MTATTARNLANSLTSSESDSRTIMVQEALQARQATHAELTAYMTSGNAARNPQGFADLADTLAYYNRLLANLGWTPDAS